MSRRVAIDSARMAWWLTAWLGGRISPDDLFAAVLDGDAAHHVTGLDGGTEPEPLLLALGPIRRSGAVSAGLALPVAGDLVGLGGPAGFNALALAAGEAVVLAGAGLGLVPHRAGAGVVWQAVPADRRPLDDLGTADRNLRRSISASADALVDLDVARWRPEVADELMSLHRSPSYAAPAGTPSRAVDLAGRASQALAIVDLALADDGAAVSARQAQARTAALQPLARAGRRAMVAACSPEVWPPEPA
ncbi:hypothetical protein [Nocardioides sp. AE5]|uniref:hypothetical protein n=1 Tax=Nocardioides sp. AE5 TaxID=2962573 RepID=UPI002881527C|nr:hypothetical protein [Nocardioides sp. AE5]MDT0203607.1 hypothetical protein [Nocardioides sp. AE5]